MPVGWASTVVALCVAVIMLAVILLGLLRQVLPVLERAAAADGLPSVRTMGPPLGGRLPHLPLAKADGKIIEERLRGDRPAVLLFLTPGCGPCKFLAGEMSRIDLSTLSNHMVIITSPDGPEELGIPTDLPILIELDRELSDPLRVNGTPFAIAVGPGGIVKAKRVPNSMKQVVDLFSTDT